MKPTVGRIVQYVSYGTPGGEYTSECRAGIVTEVLKPLLPERRRICATKRRTWPPAAAACESETVRMR